VQQEVKSQALTGMDTLVKFYHYCCLYACHELLLRILAVTEWGQDWKLRLICTWGYCSLHAAILAASMPAQNDKSNRRSRWQFSSTLPTIIIQAEHSPDRRCEIPWQFHDISLTVHSTPAHVKCYSYHASTSVIVICGGKNITVRDPKPKWNAQTQQSQELMQICAANNKKF